MPNLSGASLRVAAYNSDSTAATIAMTATFDGKVGIGTTNPQRRLHVFGDAALVEGLLLLADLDANSHINQYENGLFHPAMYPRYFYGQYNDLIIQATSAGYLGNIHFVTGSNIVGTDPPTQRMLIKGNGRVAVGAIDPQYKLHVDGDIKANGTLYASSCSCPSSKEFKRDIQEISAPLARGYLDKLKSLRLVAFHYREDPKSRPLRLGVVAEEAPREIVSPDGKAVSLSDYITFVAGAVKALAAEFDGLAASNTRLLAENDELRRQNAALASRLEALEHRVTAVERQERVAVVMTSAR
jgi:hypothetical protein